MATVYKVELEVVSDYVNLSTEDISFILKSTIEKWKSDKTGLGIRVTNIKAVKNA